MAGGEAIFAVVALPLLIGIALWLYPEVMLFFVGAGLAAIGIVLFATAAAILQEGLAVNLIIGGLILIGLGAVVKAIKANSP